MLHVFWALSHLIRTTILGHGYYHYCSFAQEETGFERVNKLCKAKQPLIGRTEGAVAQLCPIICDRMDCSPSGSSVHGISQARILKWIAMPSSRGSSPFGIEPSSPALQADSLLPSNQAIRKALM